MCAVVAFRTRGPCGVEQAMPAEPEISFKVALSAAQLDEVWKSSTDADALKKLADILAIEEFDEEPRTAIWVDFLYLTLAYAKSEGFTPAKALAFFNVMVATEEYTIGAQTCPAFCRHVTSLSG